MTMKFMEEGLRFGRTWVDRIMGKVDKDQGVANAGKVLGIGADGIVTPVEQSGGGGGTRLSGTFTPTELATKILNGELTIGDIIHIKPNASVMSIQSAEAYTISESPLIKAISSYTTASSYVPIDMYLSVAYITTTSSATIVYFTNSVGHGDYSQVITVGGAETRVHRIVDVNVLSLYVPSSGDYIQVTYKNDARCTFEGILAPVIESNETGNTSVKSFDVNL